MKLFKFFIILFLFSFSFAKQIKVPEVIFPIEIQAKKYEEKPKLKVPDKVRYEEKISIVFFTKELPPYPPYDVPPPLGSLKPPKAAFKILLPEKKKLLADAIELYDKKDYIFAEGKLKKLISKYPDTKEAARGLYLLGEKYFNAIKTPELQQDLVFWESIVDMLNGKTKEALNKLETINCTDLEIRTVSYCVYTKSYLYLNNKQYEKSLRYALKYLSDVEREEEEARILGKVKKFPYKKHVILVTAYDYLTRDKELAQNLYLQLANLYVDRKEFEKALVVLHKALGVSPGFKEYIKKKIAVNAYNTGRYQYAINIIKSIDDPLFKLYGGYAAYKLKKYDLAEKFFKEAYRRGNDLIKKKALTYLAEIYYWSNKDPEFLAVVKLLKAYDNKLASDFLGWYYFKKGDYKRAYQYFKDTYMKAVSAFNAGMIDKAYRLIKNRKDRKSLFSFFSEGKYWSAIKEFKEFVKRFKNHPLTRKAILRIADSYYNVGKIEKARKIYRDFLKRYANAPEAVDAAYQLTVLEMKSSTGNVEKQIENFISKYPDYPFVDLLKLQL